MSTHYHAYQARGFNFDVFAVQKAQWQERFAGFDPAKIVEILQLPVEDGKLYVTYFGRQYRLRLSDGVLEKMGNYQWTERLWTNEAMSVYHYLYYTKDRPGFKGSFVPSSSLEGSGIRNTNVPDPLLDPFARRFSGRTAALREVCERLGGRKLAQGDVSYEFDSFPTVPLRLIFWDAEEEFPAQARVLMDEKATDYMDAETVGCVVSDLLELIEQEDFQLYASEAGDPSLPPLILLHGNGEDGSYFSAQMTDESLTGRRHLIAVDSRRHGKTPRGGLPMTLRQFADDLHVFLLERGIRKADILGFSDGGNVALLFALKYPEQVDRLILNGANLDPSGLVPYVYREILEEHRNAQEDLEARDEALRQDALRRLEYLELMMYDPALPAEELAKLQRPVLVIAGTEDLIAAEHTRMIAESIPGAELCFLTGSHFVAKESPEGFNEAVAAFLDLRK